MSCVMSETAPEESGAPILGRAEIEAREARRPVRLAYISTWNAQVYVRVINAGEWDHIEAMRDRMNAAPGSCEDARVYAVACFLSDENGHRLYNDKQLPIIAGWKTTVVNEIFDAGIAFNTPTDAMIEEFEKN